MSTIFGVLKKEYETYTISYDKDGYLKKSNYASPDETEISWEEIQEMFGRVASRHNGGGGRWLNPIADLLPDDTKVWALDNTPQGVYTIKDLKELMQWKK